MRISDWSSDVCSSDLRGFHVYAASGNLERIIATAIDLSVVKEAGAKAKQLQDELVHVSSVNAMGAMASTLAHELNQPLTAISNYLGGCERSEERRGGEEGGRTCRSRWSPDR